MRTRAAALRGGRTTRLVARPVSAGAPTPLQPRLGKLHAMTEHLTVESFRPHLHEEFRLESHTVELVEITEIPREPGGRVPFSLVFQGGPTPPLPQRIHRVEHPEMGAMDIFLVPIGPDRYEAVFT